MEEHNILVRQLVFVLILTLIWSVIVLIHKRKINKRVAEHQKQWDKIKSENPPELWDELYDQYLDGLFHQYRQWKRLDKKHRNDSERSNSDNRSH